MLSTTHLMDLVKRRYSCRTYREIPLDEAACRALAGLAEGVPPGPFGTHTRFLLIAATREDPDVLRDLGTYGVIQHPAAFVAGAMKPSPRDLEDFGYQMEWLILQATRLGLDTCWLGGYFTRSSFASRMQAGVGEMVPAVFSVGYCAPDEPSGPGKTDRIPWEELFFDGDFGAPLPVKSAGEHVMALEAVRLAPSASNKQPWRMVKDGDHWHLFLFRTPGYRERWVAKQLVVEDLQRVDMGIAMCHFELAARELGLGGRWELCQPEIRIPDPLGEYSASWVAER